MVGGATASKDSTHEPRWGGWTSPPISSESTRRGFRGPREAPWIPRRPSQPGLCTFQLYYSVEHLVTGTDPGVRLPGCETGHKLVCVYMYVCTHSCMSVWAHAGVHLCAHVCAYACDCVHAHCVLCVHACVCTPMYMHVCACVLMCVCMCTHVMDRELGWSVRKVGGVEKQESGAFEEGWV